MAAPRIHVGPAPTASVLAAVEAGGGTPAPLDMAEAVVWLDGDPASLPALPERVRWVQLPGAGVDRWLARVAAEPSVEFSSAVGVYGPAVAEHALALLLAGVRGLPAAVPAREWTAARPGALEGATVAVIGAGDIGGTLIGLLGAHRVRAVAVTRSGRAVAGADLALPVERVDEAFALADHVVLAAPATKETRGLVNDRRLAAMRRHGWLVNVGRGAVVDTDALVRALREGRIGGAALDVTDPEPLPAGHPLWDLALITPHVATPPAPRSPHFAARVRENVERFAAGRPPLHPVDPARAY